MHTRHVLQQTALLTLLAGGPVTVARAQSDVIVEIRRLSPREHRVEGFVLAAPQTLHVEAVGAEPRRDDRRSGSRREARDWWGDDDERETWPAAAWILDARTRQVVWDLRTAGTPPADDGLRRFAGTVRLPAGLYEAHYASYPAIWTSFETGGGGLTALLRGLARRGDDARYGGPYVDDGAFRQFELVVRGAGRRARATDLAAALRASAASAIASLRPNGPGASERVGLEVQRPTDVEVVAVGELRRDGAFDYAWLLNADTRDRVWEMEYDHSAHAGGARKNRVARDTLRLAPGRYVAYFVTDDSHDPEDWNTVPPFDPASWGLTLRVADPAARTAVRSFDYEPVPGQTIVSLIGVGDDELRSEGFTLRRPLEVRIYALGEGGEDHMHDYAWIVDAATRRPVWTMRYEDTEHAGGAEKNRLFDGTLRLDTGSYLVYYATDDSHASGAWNAAAPAESRYWGVSVFPATGRLDRGVVGPLEPRGDTLAAIVSAGHDERARVPFQLGRPTTVRIYALGEGNDGEMYDYAWIEDARTGRRVWEMSYDRTEHAGGAGKNRRFDGVVPLPAGAYALRYESDGSHAFGDWNADPPDDPAGWGVTLLRVGR